MSAAAAGVIRCTAVDYCGPNVLYSSGRAVFGFIFLMFFFCTGFVLRLAVEMKLHTIVTLSSMLVAAILIDLASCDTKARNSSLQKERVARKYYELEDLNKYESPVATISRDENTRLKRSDQQQQQQRQRVTRQQTQQKKQRPGFLWTLARVTYETFNDTKSAIQQLTQIVNTALPAEAPKKMKKPTLPPKQTSANLKVNVTANAGTGVTTEAPTTTTEKFVLTRPLLQSILTRNIKGLVRLFNIEWRDAMNQSKQTAAEFRRELGNQIGTYLQDNPKAYR